MKSYEMFNAIMVAVCVAVVLVLSFACLWVYYGGV